MLRACEAPDAGGEVINVAAGGRISLNELFEAIRSIVGADAKPTFAGNREGDVRDSQADITSARELLGYEPIVPFEEGLRTTIDWYRTQSERASR